MIDESPEPEPEIALGLAAERTELAWGRSSLALLGCGAAVAKGLDKVTGTTGRPLVGAVLLALGGVAWLSGLPYARVRAQATRDGRRAPVRKRELAIIAAGTAIVGAAGLVVAAFFPA